MKICMPTMDARGSAGELSEHFGRAPYFTMVDSDTGSVEIVANPEAGHAKGSCSTAELLGGQDVGAVVCRGLGRNALDRLVRLGVTVYRSDHSHVAGALAAYRRGEVHRVTSEIDCRGNCAHHH
jgi:predicted Fe-Mo cluster-binding NifX family protein